MTLDLVYAIIDKLILLVALIAMGYGIFHLAHHDPQSSILEWAKSTFTMLLGALLTLIRGQRVRPSNGNGNGSNGNDHVDPKPPAPAPPTL